MLGGESLSYSDRRQIDSALAMASRVSDIDFEAYIGPAGEDARAYALAVHSQLARPDNSVLVLCDPESRALEIVTGHDTRQYLSDADCRLAVATMTSSFLAGLFANGLARGISQLGEIAHHPETLHAAGLL
ncbi:MAG: DUF5130 family protein [Microlunatus sp.]